MASIAPLRRFAALDWRRRLIVGEALLAVALVSAAAAILPFRYAIRLGARIRVKGRELDAASADRITWSVARVAGLVPWRAKCLQRGLAVQAMLRRREVDAILRYGVGKLPDGALAAHAWVTVGPTIVIGGEAASDFREVARWPAS